ncbi:DNA-3-methyladenine glycosylase I [Limosilactobacillus caecicola]|uniref:DNA-3-methyladenine glycosylase I n=1 Tax=Limosilactobacillus caecicola TaxID=2941332 RepID=UPI00203E61F6|nr:DNA-3-methyladenine glycosylase I [Limosilactobacillus caecicola]
MTKQYPDWATTPLMQEYYDQKWGFPVHDERELFKMLTLETFQAGLSWATIWQRQAAFEAAFANFNVATIARFDETKVAELMANPDIIRNRRKIEATINNARVLLSYHRVGKTLDHFLWSFVNGQPIEMNAGHDTVLPASTPLSTEISRQLKRAGFKFVGPTTVFSLLCAVGIVNGRLS